jgi:hypothetical protein
MLQCHFGTTQAYWIDHKPIYFVFKLLDSPNCVTTQYHKLITVTFMKNIFHEGNTLYNN